MKTGGGLSADWAFRARRALLCRHITVDIGHADGWLNNVIVPIGKKHPAAMEEVFFGAALRLQTCNDYYDGLLAALQSLGGSLSSHSVPPSE
ncbi:spermidine/putrescine ABC transporter [Klebsiella pneumoniae]|uniref:Spermidine/putrescine ABC transporter n=1 Tax=Klebsiella pneumoniae TaxID=573 RepID=A0A377TXQ0_KLEPN|nr:spermidine/putrescine ABC transporter [Klebsiella pneumoniae]